MLHGIYNSSALVRKYSNAEDAEAQRAQRIIQFSVLSVPLR